MIKPTDRVKDAGAERLLKALQKSQPLEALPCSPVAEPVCWVQKRSFLCGGRSISKKIIGS
jgi:hypothetical protein